MNDRQRYLFDLQGYLLVEDVLTAEEWDAAIAAIDARKKPPQARGATSRTGTRVSWSR